jgi:hypothetical protein
MVAEIDKQAEELGLTRSQMMGNLIDASMDDLKLLKRTVVMAT